MSVELDVDAAGFASAVARLRGGLDDAGQRGITRAVDRGRTAARPRVPVRSGRLVRSLRTVTVSGGADVVAGGPGVPYAGVINFGWPRRNIGAARFLDVVETTARRVAGEEVEAEVSDLIRRVGLA